MFEIIKTLKDILAPKKCYSCSKEWHFLCKNCLEKIWYFESICPVCKQSSRDFEIHFYCKNEFVFYDKIIILTHYKNPIIKKLIKDAKFYHKKDILEDFSIYMGNIFFNHIDEKKEDLIFIQTPMFFLKKITRWYNQSEILINSLSKNFWINFDFKVIKKIKSTKPQSHLSKIERIENLKWVFKIDKNLIKKYKNKTFVIIDDVVSTWTTFNEISKLLKNNWIKKVYWLSIASD